MIRPDWDAYFIKMANLASTRSTCLRRQVGAVLVREKRILATGYNGPPSGFAHCVERGGCMRANLDIPSGQRHELCLAVHAEQNAIIQAARHGVSISGATLYCTTLPCAICAKLIVAAGIVKVVLENDGYPDDLSRSILHEAGLAVENLEG